MTIPHPLALTGDKYQPGINSLGDKRPRFEVLAFDAAMDKQFTNDAHFVCYAPVEGDNKPGQAGPWPRINKPALSSLRAVGADVMQTIICLDFDLHDHPELIGDDFSTDDEDKPLWNSQMLETFWDVQKEIAAHLWEKNVARANVVYTTTHGARFVHRLSKPIPVGEGPGESEDVVRGLIALYQEMGIQMDRKCCDWTRLFRAPRVTRGGTKTWTTPWFSIKFFDEYLTNPDAIPPVGKTRFNESYSEVRVIDRGQPTPEQAWSRLRVVLGGKERDTEKHKAAKKVLKGTDCYSVVFEDQPLAPHGSRDSTLIKLVGQAIAFLLPSNYNFDPEDVYALFLPAVEQLDPDSGTPDWTASLWSKIKNCWQREDAKVRAQRELSDKEREKASTKDEKMLVLLRETCDLPGLHSNEERVALAALDSMKLIVDPSGKVRVLTPDGYSSLSMPASSVHLLIKQFGAGDVIETTHENKHGEVVQTRYDNIISRYGTAVARIEGQAGATRNYVKGNTKSDLTLVESLYRRADLAPEYNERVEKWLKALVGEAYFDELCRWIAWALAFEEGPIAALSLAGAAGAGKGMLVRGLLECLAVPAFATGRDLVKEKNVGLKTSPFMVVDEGLPRRLPGGMDIADAFRSLVAGEPQIVDEKYKALMTVRNPMRVVFTANNNEVIQQLAERTLSEDDLNALAVRIRHFDVQSGASYYLASQGGMAYTKGWVEPPAGGQSDYTLARHFLALYQDRHSYKRDDRLLVEGDAHAQVVQDMRTAEPSVEYIARLLVRFCESPKAQSPIMQKGIAFYENKVLVTAAAVHEAVQADLSTKFDMSLMQVSKALRNLCDGESSRLRRKTEHGTTQNKWWWQLDLTYLLGFARHYGLPCSMIARLTGDEEMEEENREMAHDE